MATNKPAISARRMNSNCQGSVSQSITLRSWMRYVRFRHAVFSNVYEVTAERRRENVRRQCRFRRPEGDDLVIEAKRIVVEALHTANVVRCNEHRSPFLRQPLDDLQELLFGCNVESCCRFVQEKNLRRPDERPREQRSSLLSAT